MTACLSSNNVSVVTWLRKKAFKTCTVCTVHPHLGVSRCAIFLRIEVAILGHLKLSFVEFSFCLFKLRQLILALLIDYTM